MYLSVTIMYMYVFTRIVAQGTIIFLPKNKDKTLQIVLHLKILGVSDGKL